MMDMIDSKTMRTATVLLCFTACLALGITFTRDGTGNYNDEAKWDHEGGFCYASPYCYPHTTNDNGVIDEVVTITLDQDETIDDLQISGRSEFPTIFTTDTSNTTVVTCDSISITLAWVKLTEKAGLVAEGTDPCPGE